MRSAGAGRRVALALVGCAALWSSGCGVAYVTRAAYEEAKILWRRQPIETVLEKPGVPVAEKEKLRTVLEVRRFAKDELGLHVGGSFETVSRVDAGALVHLLVASRRDRLEPYTWWFPIVGRVPYKGFFSKDAAVSTAQRLEGEGYDTYLRPAIAFSTLGWFDDPLPSLLLRQDEVQLAEILFHELFHATLFVPGEVTFDESAATFTGYRGAIAFFCDGPASNPAQCEEATRNWQDTLTISRFLRKHLLALETFYASDPSEAELEKGRARAFAAIREEFRGLKLQPGRIADFVTGSINNASLLEERVYLHDLDVFDELYRLSGGLRPAIQALETAVDRGGDPFHRLYEAVSEARSAGLVRSGSGPRS